MIVQYLDPWHQVEHVTALKDPQSRGLDKELRHSGKIIAYVYRDMVIAVIRNKLRPLYDTPTWETEHGLTRGVQKRTKR